MQNGILIRFSSSATNDQIVSRVEDGSSKYL